MRKAVFWDFDGTLVRANSPWSNSFHRSILKNVPDCPITLEEVRPLMRSGFTWDEPEGDYREITGKRWWDRMNRRFSFLLHGLGFPEDLCERISGDIRGEVLDVSRYSAFPDAEAALEEAASKGYANYILSNNFPELEGLVVALGLRRYFAAVVTSSLVGYEKPNQGIFTYAKVLSGNPEACFMIGDNPIADIEGGKAAGMRTVLVHKGFDERADYCFDNLLDASKVL